MADQPDWTRYVGAALDLQGFEPDPERERRVLEVFAATAALAAPLLALEQADALGPAPVFEP